ncbi:hypothetical protein PPYR_06559 [Photinus pyralis]|uniref:WAP domain-containing protein n=1 Tax=Photinus pyralis TaxID=7054 RepID=A0A1Y1ME15_PHOPY|nr:WAP four-disulfide core domain protein 2-like [Photinus pyralis]KAB0800820.1 hypothetical protein PPYR_06559 [Photinus pyralis]
MGQHPLALLFFASSIIAIFGQKLGDCPDRNSLKHCGYTCFQDAHCRGDAKCCKNECGGFVCVPPVIAVVSKPVEPEPIMPSQPESPPVVQPVADTHRGSGKTGTCPSTPTGPWVCTSVCSNDSHCPGSRKCCKNRCGAFTCTNPIR